MWQKAVARAQIRLISLGGTVVTSPLLLWLFTKQDSFYITLGLFAALIFICSILLLSHNLVAIQLSIIGASCLLVLGGFWWLAAPFIWEDGGFALMTSGAGAFILYVFFKPATCQFLEASWKVDDILSNLHARLHRRIRERLTGISLLTRRFSVFWQRQLVGEYTRRQRYFDFVSGVLAMPIFVKIFESTLKDMDPYLNMLPGAKFCRFFLPVTPPYTWLPETTLLRLGQSSAACLSLHFSSTW